MKKKRKYIRLTKDTTETLIIELISLSVLTGKNYDALIEKLTNGESKT